MPESTPGSKLLAPSAADQAFLAAVQDCSLDPSQFGHLGHVRLAWICCRLGPLKEAIRRVSNLIETYAGSLGATGKFHQTLTSACVVLVADSIHAQESWDAYIERGPEILTAPRELLARHYSPAIMASAAARDTFVAPDRQPLPSLDPVV